MDLVIIGGGAAGMMAALSAPLWLPKKSEECLDSAK